MKAFGNVRKYCNRQTKEDQEAEALAGRAVRLIMLQNGLDRKFGVDPDVGADLFWEIQHRLLAFLRDPSGSYQQSLQ